MDNIYSPHVVLGEKCLRAAVRALDGEILSAGETGTLDTTAEELPEDYELDAPSDDEIVPVI